MIAPNIVMDNRRLQRLIEREAKIVEREPGFWRLEYDDRTLLVMTDEEHDRMRVMSPVLEEQELDGEDLRVLLSANFDRALDAKYALANGVLWSVFVHPLHELTERMFCDVLEQVATLAENFGGSYASSDLFFNGGTP